MGYRKLTTIILVLCMACVNKHPNKNNDPYPTSKPNISILKQNTKKYLSAWREYDTLLQQSVTIQKFVRNVNGVNMSYDQHELYKCMYYWHSALPDLLIVLKEITVVENRTYANWECHGTNTGMLGNTPPTGKVAQTKGISVLTFNDAHKIVHEATYFDMLSFMEELGYSLSLPVME